MITYVSDEGTSLAGVRLNEASLRQYILLTCPSQILVHSHPELRYFLFKKNICFSIQPLFVILKFILKLIHILDRKVG